MKKITLFLTMLVAMASTATAQMSFNSTPAATLDDGTYVIYGINSNNKNGGFINGNYNITNQSYNQGDKVDATYVWTLTNNTADGTFTLYNASTNKYFVAGGQRGAAWGTFSGTDTANLQAENHNIGGVDYFMICQTNYTFSNSNNADYGKISYVHTNGTTMSWWAGIGDITTTTTGSGVKFIFYPATATLASAQAAVYAKLDEVEAFAEYIGTGIGKYSSSEEFYNNKVNVLATINWYREDWPLETIDACNEAIAAIEGIVATFSLNMPTSKNYYRFESQTHDEYYMLSDDYNQLVNYKKRLAMGAGTGANSIFYLDENNALLSYANGRYLPKAVSGGDWNCLAIGVEGEATTFAAGCEISAYGFYIGNDENRAYYSGHTTHVDAGGKIANNDGYDWVITKVETLPVTISAAGKATFYAPVAVEIPENVKAYYISSLKGEYAILTEIVGVIPAETAVILEGAADTYYFDITDDVEHIEGNMLHGTIASEILPNNNVYILAYVGEEGGEKELGMYGAYNGDDKTTFINAGHKAYLLATEALAQSAGFRFEFGTTGIENVESAVESNIYYDLSGRRVENPVKGIYIVNGKKVLVK